MLAGLISNLKHKQIQMYLGATHQANLITGGGRNSKHAYPREQDLPMKNNHYLEKQDTPPKDIKSNHTHNHRNNYNANSQIHAEDDDIVFPSEFQYVYENGQDSQDFDGQGLNQNQIFEIDGCKFSPIANTYIEDNEPAAKYHNERLPRDAIRPYKTREQQKCRNTKPQSPRWKDFLNPDVQKFYDSIMKNQHINKSNKQTKNQGARIQNPQYSHQIDHDGHDGEQNQEYENHKEQKSQRNYGGYKSHKSHNLSVGNERIKETRNKSTMENEIQVSQVEDMKKRYEDKISVLEHQNNNLKDELFYLRAAILAQYEAREQVKASHK